jgi:PAS domain S-box-containing protein
MLKHAKHVPLGGSSFDNSVFALLDLFSEPAFLIDPTGRIIDANAAFASCVSKSVRRLIGANLYDLQSSGLVVPGLATGLRERSGEALLTGKRITFEEALDGKRFSHSITPVGSTDGGSTHLFVVVQEFVDQHVEPDGPAKLDLHKTIYDAIPCSIVLMDELGCVLWMNRFAQMNISPNPEDDSFGFDAFETIHPDDKVRAREQFLNLLHTGREETIEVRRAVQGGTDHVWRMVHGSRIMIGDKQHVLAIGLDINERKQIEFERQRLLESQAGLLAALEISHIGKWELDLVEKTALASLEHDRIFGYDSLKEWTYKSFLDHIVPEDRDEVDRRYQDAVATRTDWNSEYRIRRVDGEVRWVWSVGGFQSGISGRSLRMFGIMIDITERKREEEERAILQAQLQQAQKMHLIGQLAGGIAHDFNNVMTTILCNTELLLGKVDDGHPFTENLEDIRSSVTRTANLVRQLLAFARKQSVNPKILRLDEAAFNLEPMLRRLIPENIQFDWRLGSDNARIRFDPSQFDRIITNLCVNARDAINGNGTITIVSSTERVEPAESASGHPCGTPGEYVRISITDTGSGIDPKALPHIFEPFFTTKEAGKGTGLGLSTTYGIVKQHNGFIDCMTDPGNGTTFSVYLPRYAELVREERPEGPSPLSEHSTETILLVEDETYILKILKDILEDDGHEVLSALDAEQAVIIAKKSRKNITLLVTDIMLPNMNGIELSDRLRVDYPELKVLFMSGYAPEEIVKKRTSAKRDGFIQKPFTIEDFTRSIYTTARSRC